MFFVKRDGALVETGLQSGDRIRVRPRLGQFFVWRPAPRVIVIAGFHISSLHPRNGDRLWTPNGEGSYRQWWPLPKGIGVKGDALSLIIAEFGETNFRPEGLSWLDEPVKTFLDGRFDYVAVGAPTARVAP